MRLTTKSVTRFTPPKGKSDHIEFDDDLAGFGIRYRNGKATWVFQYSHGTAPARINRRLTLGTFPGLPAEKARGIAQDLSAKVRLGGDPATDKRTQQEEARNTFGMLVNKYVEAARATQRSTTHCEIRRYLLDFAKPLHNLPVNSIERRNIANLLDTVAERGTATANRTRSSLSACFSWGMKRGLVENNPVIGTEKLKEESRDRVLDDSELAIIWKSCTDDDFAAIVKLLILTGQRRDEISGLRWSEIDFKNNVILLPAGRTKNKRAHEIPVSQAMDALLSSRKRTEGRDLVFGKRVEPIAGWGWRKRALDRLIGDRIKPWTLHDLRRSAATGMANVGIQPHVIEAILNHVSGSKRGVAGIYNRSTYAREKKQALDLWADHVTAIVEGRDNNITPFRGNAS
jgi:integrase